MAPGSQAMIAPRSSTVRRQRQNDVRWIPRAVMDRVIRRRHAPIAAERLARVRVQIEARKVAARDVDANAMALLEDVGGGKRLDGEWIYRARHEHHGVVA